MLLRSKHLTLIALVAGLLLSACSPFGGGPGATQNTQPSATSAPQTTQQVLQNTLKAMQQLKTIHIAMNIATDTKSATDEAMLNIKIEGDSVLPDQSSLQLAMGQGMADPQVKLSEIVTGNKIYLRNQKGQWYVSDLAAFTRSTGNPFASAQFSNFNNLLTQAQKVNVIDNGTETLNGQNVNHLTADFGKDSLLDLLNATGQLNNLQPQQRQRLQNSLDSVNLQQQPTLDLWIDPATSYVQRMELKFMLSTQDNITSSVDSVIDYSHFNASITINPPTNATPTDNPAAVLK